MNQPTFNLRAPGPWARTRIPELALLAFGIFLRVSMAWSFNVGSGYDFATHHQYLRYIVEHGSLPPYDLNAASYHPPLFYLLGAGIEFLGAPAQVVGGLSIASACVQLMLLWLGLELYLPGRRAARVLALAIAAVIPASIHVAGLLSNEALSDVLCTGALVLLPRALTADAGAGRRWAIGAGICLGLALLTKVSAVMVVASLLAAVTLAVLRAPVRALTFPMIRVTALVLSLAAVLGGWHYARHRILYGSFIITGYDQWATVDETQKIPYLDRRTLGFVASWNEDIYRHPFWPSATMPRARFWPTLVATTFTDYYNYGFVAAPAPGVPATKINNRPLPQAAVAPARASVVGGTALALLAVLAWLVAARALWRRQDHARLLLLLCALAAAVGQLHFAIRFPYDPFGPIKGAYLQFAGPIYCALAGLGIATLWQRRQALARLAAVAGVAAIGLVAVYTLYARLLAPLGL